MVFLSLALVFSGCLLPETEVVAKVKQSPSVASFLAQHPNAQLTFTPLSRQQSQARADEFIAKCGPNFAANDYYYIMFSEGADSVEVLVGQKTNAIVCIHRSDDLCVSDEACDDQQACTIDSCMGAPKECKQEQITQCVAVDNCCPAQCDYKSDSDCEVPPPPECTTDSDCDDWDRATKDKCVIGTKNKCTHELITECSSGDAFCPSGCNYATDTDCETAECTADANCNDNDLSTVDKCSGVPAICTHEKITKCLGGDGYCPNACDSRTDWDCLAAPGDIERITVKCGSNEAKIDSLLFDAGNGVLKANVSGFATNANNKTLLSYSQKSYKYNDVETAKINMSETISIVGTVLFDKARNKSKLSLEQLSYTVDLGEGIPATHLPGNDAPFAAGGDDKIIIPLFTADALVTSVDRSKGEVDLVSNQTWLSATNGSVLSNIEGSDGEMYNLKVSRCDADKMVFSLSKGATLVAGQTAAVGDILFPDRLKRTIRINYYHQSSANICDYRYSIGGYLEKIYDGKPFPSYPDLDVYSDWEAELEFSGKRLLRIKLSLGAEKLTQNPLTEGNTIAIISAENTAAKNSCTLKFNGLTR